MRRAIFLLVAGLCAAAPAGGRALLGQYQRWGAFREAPGWCFAIAEPVGGKRRDRRAYVAISRRGGAPTVYVEASRAVRAGTALRLEVDGRAVTGGDARVIAAIRRGDTLRIAGTDERGRRFHDDYPLAGAPSAIDAAIVGCL